jgi:hypothetical protein
VRKKLISYLHRDLAAIMVVEARGEEPRRWKDLFLWNNRQKNEPKN